MIRSALLIAVLALAGCASQERVAEVARSSPDWEVCQVYATGQAQYRGVLMAEIQRRGIDCRPHWATIEQAERIRALRSQQSAADAATALQIMRATQPQIHPIPASNSLNCRSYKLGNSVQTDCN